LVHWAWEWLDDDGGDILVYIISVDNHVLHFILIITVEEVQCY
jgi:hypothetical protein